MSNEEVKLENNNAAISRIVMPSFCRSNPATWFKIVESTFIINNLKNDDLKYHHVMISLPEDILNSILDLINDPPAENKYETIRKTVLERHTESESKRLTKLLDGVIMGDDIPSSYFRKLQNLAGESTAINNDLLKKMWLNGLPSYVKTVLAASDQKDQGNLINIADKIVEMGQPSGISEIKVNSKSSSLIETKIANIEKKVNEVLAISTNNYGHRSRSPYKNNRFNHQKHFGNSRSNFRRRNSSSYKYNRNKNNNTRSKSLAEKYPNCFYHYKYGKNAHKCQKPCNFENNTQPKND